MKLTTLLAGAACLVLAGCSSTGNSDASTVAKADNQQKGDGMYCTRYKPTGSHRFKTRCITAEQRKRELEEGQKLLSDAQRHTSVIETETGM